MEDVFSRLGMAFCKINSSNEYNFHIFIAHHGYYPVQHKWPFKKRASLQSLGKFLFVGLFCIVSVSLLNIPIVASI